MVHVYLTCIVKSYFASRTTHAKTVDVVWKASRATIQRVTVQNPSQDQLAEQVTKTHSVTIVTPPSPNIMLIHARILTS